MRIDRETLLGDLYGGITAAIVALPLALDLVDRLNLVNSELALLGER